MRYNHSCLDPTIQTALLHKTVDSLSMSWLGPGECIEILSETQHTKLWYPKRLSADHDKNTKHLYSDYTHTLKADFRSEDELM
jgi:hypothetical protein